MVHAEMNGSKAPYSKPQLTSYGSIARTTLGQGGSSLDGDGSYTQTGQGNNTNDPTPTNP